MIYTVTWHPSAEARLTTLWNDALDQQAITDSSNRIDDELKSSRTGREFHSDNCTSTVTIRSLSYMRSIPVIAW